MKNLMDEIIDNINRSRDNGVEISLEDSNLIIIKDNTKYKINLMEGCVGKC